MSRISKSCRQCSKQFSIPRCRDYRDHFCSSECGKKYRIAKRDALLRDCLTCGAKFRPRPIQVRNGVGRFCSQACNTAGQSALNTPEVQAKSKDTWKARYKAGLIVPPKREQSYQWRGGEVEMKLRRKESGAQAATHRKYRAAHPHKVREWSNNRRCRTIGRLPRNTISGLYLAQRGCCPICRQSLGKSYHVDHIVPLASGGKHEKHNIQLLCQSCNCRKAAKDPIDYMQSRGFLI